MTIEEAKRTLESWSHSPDVTLDQGDDHIVQALAEGHRPAIEASRRRGFLQAAELLRQVRPCSIPVVDAARAAEMAVPQQGFYDDEYFVVTPGTAPVLQNGRVA